MAAGDGNFTTWTDPYCTPSTAYSYTVKVTDNVDLSSMSARIDINSLSGTAPADTTAPTTPTALVGSPVSSTQINLSWSASSDNIAVSGYRIYQNGTQVSQVTGVSYMSTGLMPLTTYNFSVAAYDAAGNVSVQSPVTAVTTLQANTSTTTATTTP